MLVISSSLEGVASHMYFVARARLLAHALTTLAEIVLLQISEKVKVSSEHNAQDYSASWCDVSMGDSVFSIAG